MLTTNTLSINDLKEMSDDEIKALIMAHPYCQNLYHQLLENNIDQEGTGSFEDILQRASLYSVDREFLFQKVRKLKQEAEVEKLDLMELAIKKEELEQIRIADAAGESVDFITKEKEYPTVSPGDSGINSVYSEEEDIDTDLEDEVFEFDTAMTIGNGSRDSGLSFLEKIIDVPGEEEKPFQLDEQTLDFLTSYSKALDSNTIILDPTPNKEIKEVTPVKKASSKPKVAETPELEITNLEQVKDELKPKKVKKAILKEETPEVSTTGTENVEEYVERSVMESQEIASETLAELLVTQEQFDKAIKMYERLMLLFPEKSSFFAEKIKNISKK